MFVIDVMSTGLGSTPISHLPMPVQCASVTAVTTGMVLMLRRRPRAAAAKQGAVDAPHPHAIRSRRPSEQL